MNFTPFGGPFPGSLPVHQFPAKFNHDGTTSTTNTTPTHTVTQNDMSSAPRYHSSPGPTHFSNQHHSPVNVPVNVKYSRPEAPTSDSNNGSVTQTSMMNQVANSTKYTNVHYTVNVPVSYAQQTQQQSQSSATSPSLQEREATDGEAQEQQQQEQLQQQQKQLQQQQQEQLQQQQQQQQQQQEQLQQQQQEQLQQQQQQQAESGETGEVFNGTGTVVGHHLHHHGTQTTMPASWQSLATPGSTVADYLSHLPASTLPISLHHFLKYSAESIKKESEGNPPPPTTESPVQTVAAPTSVINMNAHHPNNGVMSPNGHDQQVQQLQTVQQIQVQHEQHHEQQPGQVVILNPALKKKKKKKAKEKKPRPKPGEIRLTTALDGSTLYCCPECHMAYPEKELLEQHLLGHTLERRFVCNICGAGLKRKDHLTRHKQSHNPERPFVCSVCLKAFKRKEQLTLHFVIHSGEKRHVCTECGKGFYRKDHLRKHTRSHIARRVKAEMTQNNPPAAAPGLVLTLQHSGPQHVQSDHQQQQQQQQQQMIS